MRRRLFLQALSVGCGTAFGREPPAVDAASLIESIEKQTVLHGRDGSGPTWFHPRACMVPGKDGPTAFMTLQPILGSDLFGPVHRMTSADLGRTWTTPEPVPPLGREPLDDGGEEGVCDVVPEWHPRTSSVLALGHNVFYKGPKFSKDQPPRWPVYAVWRDGRWGPRRRLEWDDPRGASIYSSGCGQRLTLPDGDILVPLRFAARPEQPKAVATAVCGFDGAALTIRRVGAELRHDAGRGLLEPSLVRFGDRILITLRAEDGRGYVAASDDGLAWEPKRAWAWDDGEPLETSTTQQHWLTHSERLDLLSVGGPLSIASTSADPFKINLWTLSGVAPDVSGSAANFNAASSYSWKIATATGGITGFSADKFAVVSSATNGTGGFANSFGTGTFSIAKSGNDLNLVFTAGAPSVITINVPSGTQTQTQAGYATLSGSIPVVKTGAGTLVLDQANTLSGSTTVQGGLLRLANGTALASSRLVVVAGGTGQVAPVTTTGVASLDLATGNGLLDLTSGALTIASGMTGPQL
ncbi:MAG: autotransporter-associated beta strand repeat-containing protein, partial [Planctomycetaceae bacterium]